MSTTNPLALPPTLSPDSLDALTELTAILNRLRNAIQAANSSGAGGITGATPLPTGTTPNTLGASPGGMSSLNLRDLSAQTDTLKHKIQRVRAQIQLLPDMDRDAEEQEAEMRELEEKIKLQRQVLESLRERGVKFGTEGEKMDTE